MLQAEEQLRGLRERMEAVPAWYHTLELAPGLVTPGYYDLRPIVPKLPWPDVRGKRCLDIGSYDGFYAFELERRGASEVVALDVADPRDWDWPPDAREEGLRKVLDFTDSRHAPGFDVACEAFGSSVQKVDMRIYDLAPGRVGRFDVVVCGSLLLHLRDPIGALEAVRSVCAGQLLSIDEIRLSLALLGRRPLAALDGSGERVQWWIPNPAARRRMLYAAGFSVDRATRPFAIPYGVSHLPDRPFTGGIRGIRRRALQRVLAGGVGVPHNALLASPRL